MEQLLLAAVVFVSFIVLRNYLDARAARLECERDIQRFLNDPENKV